MEELEKSVTTLANVVRIVRVGPHLAPIYIPPVEICEICLPFDLSWDLYLRFHLSPEYFVHRFGSMIPIVKEGMYVVCNLREQ